MSQTNTNDNNLFLAQGDITQICAHALVYSTDLWGNAGYLFAAFSQAFPDFAERFAQGYVQARGERECLTEGDTFWLPLLDTQRPHGIVVVVTRGQDRATKAQKEAGRRSAGQAIREAARHLRVLEPAKRLLIVLPALLMGQGGEGRHGVESAQAQIEAVYDALNRPELANVDAAFVTYTPALYHVYLEARKRVRELRPHLQPANIPAHLRQLAEQVRRGECVFFVGAGLSRGAGLPDWGELVKDMAEKLAIPDEVLKAQSQDADYYLDLAELFQLKHGRANLVSMVQEKYGSDYAHATPTLAHYLLMGQPVRHVITTNYDRLLERALTALRRHPQTVVRQEEVARTGSRDGVHVVKFHGDADRIVLPDTGSAAVPDARETSAPSSNSSTSAVTSASEDDIILTRSDYDAFFENRPVMAALLQGLLLNQTFFFVGYSLRDPNFRQIYSQVARMLKAAKRPAYATSFNSTAAYLTKKGLENQQLFLIEVPGNGEEQNACFLKWLDWLSEAVTGKSRLFLAPEAPAYAAQQDAPLHILRNRLIELGDQMQRLDFAVLTLPEAREVARLLSLLTEQGWRPQKQWRQLRQQPQSLAALWERIADCMGENHAEGSREEQRQMLIHALTYTENAADAARLRARLNNTILPD